jgi:hypothetical protein
MASGADLNADDEIAQVRARLRALETEQIALRTRLEELERPPSLFEGRANSASKTATTSAVTSASSSAVKVTLFRRLFVGRADVFPIRWENRKTGKGGYAPACANEWVKGVCNKPHVKCGECPNQAFIPVSDEVIERHLRGGRSSGDDFVAGVYPLLPDETCWFLTADFDKENWVADALAVLETCSAKGVPAALERSRSGNGGHIWIFFSEPVRARLARQLGALLITATMERRPEIGFASYDRFFPSQDVMPIGGFGNLIALPLQRRAREKGNSLFVDKNLRPYEDQWAFLSALPWLSAESAHQIVGEAEARGMVLSVRMPADEEDADEPWKMAPSRRREPGSIGAPLPAKVTATLADQLYLNRTELPSAMVARLIRVAAFQNPEFYRAQAMRLPTFGKPRIVSCAELHTRHVGLPRGCLDDVAQLLTDHGVELALQDLRTVGDPLPPNVRFEGELRGQQVKAFDALALHDFGVLAATTAFGKTIVAAALIAHRARNTLILVHRHELLSQWVERLKAFLNIDPKYIGVIRGGRRKPTGIIDVGLIQSLVVGGEAADLVGNYGHLVVDECHHLSASSFELAAKRSSWPSSTVTTYDAPTRPRKTPIANTIAPPTTTWTIVSASLPPMKRQRRKEMATSSHPTTTYASFSATARLGMRKGNVWSIPPNPVATPVMLPRRTGPPRPVTVPSSDKASERPMLTAAPSEAASPTKKALKGRAVSPAAAKIGASVETEPSISPSSAGCTSCNTNFRWPLSDALDTCATVNLREVQSCETSFSPHSVWWKVLHLVGSRSTRAVSPASRRLPASRNSFDQP